ncbi:hypothetical protein HaLaN_11704, partial [Haematococcus lacustris]
MVYMPCSALLWCFGRASKAHPLLDIAGSEPSTHTFSSKVVQVPLHDLSASHSAIRSNDAVLAELLSSGRQKLADNGVFPSVLGSSAKLVRNQQTLCLEEVAARLLECTFERPDPADHHSVTQQLSQLSQWLSSGDAQSAAQLLLKAGAAVAQWQQPWRYCACTASLADWRCAAAPQHCCRPQRG